MAQALLTLYALTRSPTLAAASLKSRYYILRAATQAERGWHSRLEGFLTERSISVRRGKAWWRGSKFFTLLQEAGIRLQH